MLKGKIGLPLFEAKVWGEGEGSFFPFWARDGGVSSICLRWERKMGHSVGVFVFFFRYFYFSLLMNILVWGFFFRDGFPIIEVFFLLFWFISFAFHFIIMIPWLSFV
jgi:hypothetical protein